MKRLLFNLLSAGLISVGYLSAQITVTAPNGGETWAGASTQNITWTSSGVANVNIDYSTNNGSTWISIVTNYPAASSPYPWTVVGAGPLGSTTCQVRITSTANSGVFDRSNANFTIPPSTLTIQYPNGGETFYNGQSRAIRWTSSSILNVNLFYSTNNGSAWTSIATAIPASRTFYTWTVPTISGSQYLVKAEDAANSTVNDGSNAVFSVTTSPANDITKFKGGSRDGYSMDNTGTKSITVTAPNGGESWAGATVQNITWNSTNLSDVRIEYSTNNGSSWIVIENNYPSGPQTYPWTIPGVGTLGSSQCRVRVTSVTDGSITDMSNNTWTIPGSNVTVVSPNGGESYFNGTMRPIRWTSQSVLNVRLEYSTNAGSTWSLITDSILASRTFYSWVIPSGITGTQTRVRVLDRLNYAVKDSSDTNFTIASPPANDITKFKGGSFDGYSSDNSAPKSLLLTSPNGGENWPGASTQTITWTSQNVSNVRIEYSTNNGSTWNLIISTTPGGTGSFPWVVNGAGPLGTTTARVRVTDTSDPTVTDASNGVFTIPPAAVSIQSPNGSESYQNGTMRPVRWTSASVLNVRLEYSTNNGSNWNLIVDSIPASRTFFSWLIPTGSITQQALVRVTDRTDVTVTDNSDAVFSINGLASNDITKFKGGSYDGYSSDVACIEPFAVMSGSRTICSGASANLTVQFTNSSPWSFTYSNGTSNTTLTGITTSPLLIPVTPSSNTTYLPIFVNSNLCAGTVSGNAVINVTNLATAALSGSQSLCAGQSVNLSVALTGSSPWSLAWTDGVSSFNQSNITVTPFIISVSPSANRTYTLTSVSDNCGAGIYSGSAITQVQALPTATFSGSASICPGQSAQGTINLTGSSPWNVTYSNGTTSIPLTGITANPYLLSVTPSSSITYSLVSVSNQCTGTTNGNFRVQVLPTPTATLTSGSVNICTGSSSQLTINFTGNGPWNVNYTDGVSTTPFNGISSSPFVFALSPTANRTYSLTSVNDACTGTVSGSRSISLLPNPTATLTGGSANICTGGSSQLTATLTGAGPWNLTYTDGVTPVLLLNILSSPHVWSVSPTVNRTYTLVSVSDACVGTVSGSRTVSILPVPTATLTSASANICAGGSAQQTLTLTGTGPWNTTYTDGVTPSTILNITSSPYVWNVSPGGSRTYSLVSVSDVCSGTVSGTSSVTILPTPTATLSSGNANICANGSSQLTINLTGNGPWNVNYTDGVSTSSINNITASPYVVAVSPSVSRTYSLTSLNDACTGTVSGTSSVTILPTPSASLSGSNSICPGGSSQLTINFTGNGPWNVTYSNGSANTSLTGINSSPYILSVTPIINTTYNLSNVSDACSGTVSGVGVVNLFTIPTAIISGTQTINLGQTANLTIGLSGVAPWQLNYTDGTTTYALSGITQSPYVWTVSPVQTSTYSLISVQDVNCAGSVSGSASILVNALPTATLSGSQTLCLGSTANLSIHLTGPAPWTVTYTDGVQPTTISGIVSSPYVMSVTPSQSTTYSMVSVVNPYVGTVSGTAALGVQVIPSIPSVLSATSPTCTGLTLNWSGVNGATGYYLDVAADTSFISFISGYQNQNMGTATQALLTGLTAGQTVYFRVRASGVCGTSLSSTRAQGSTLSIPSVITSSAASLVNCTGFVANWQNQINATNYRLDVAYDTLFSSYVPSYQNLSVGNTTSYSVIGLTGGQNHYYRVRGENTCGASNQSAVRTRVVTYNLRDSIVMGSNSPVCNGSTLQLTSAISIPGTTTDWTGPGGYQRLGQSQASLSGITQGQAGTYSLTVSYAGCASVVLGTSVTVNLPLTQILLGGNTTLCAGEVLQLTSSGGNGTSTYNWRGPNGFTSSLQNPQIISITSIQGGVYRLDINSPGCGQLSDSILVSVTNSQSFTVGNNSPVCEGATVYLSATNIGGTVYSWTGPNGFMDSGNAPFVLNATPLEAGIYTVSIAQPGCQNPLVYVTNVVVSPALNLNPQNNSPVCQGDTVQLSVDLMPGVFYQWLGPNGFTGNQHSVVIPNSTPSLNGVYTVSGTSPGCGYFEDHFTVAVSPTSTLNPYSNQTNICEGSNLYLYAGGNNQFAFYRWRGPNNYVASSPNPGILAVQPIHAGVYTVQQVVPGCVALYDTVEIWVSPNIQQQVLGGTNSPVCSGNSINLSATNLSGVSYLWNGPGGFTASGSSVTRVNANSGMAGLYTLTVTAGGCSPYIQTYAVVVNTLSNANASSNSPVCGGGNLTLQGTGPRGSTYFWRGPNGFTSQLATETFAGAQYSHSGVYSLTVSLPSCGVATFTTTVQVGSNLNQSSISSNLPICIGNTLGLSASYYPDASYLWTGPNGFTSSTGIDSIVGIQSSGNGVYQVTISTPGCLPINRSHTVSLLPVLTATASATTPVCQGNNLYLSGSALSGVNMVWAGPNGYSNTGATPSIVNVQPVQSGIYTLTASRTGCGVYTTSVSVQVGGNLSGLVATSNSPVCVGQTLRLSATTISNATYNWTGPNGFTSNNQNDSIPVVGALYRGQYSLTVVSPGCVTTSRVSRIVVDTIPVLSPTSNSPICQGGTLLLSTQWPINAGIVWQGPNNFNSTLRTPSLLNVPVLNAGTYTIRVTTNCGVTTATTAVTVNPSLNSIVAGSNSPLCYGQTLRLTANTIPNASYSWAGPNGFTSGIEVDSILGVTSLAAGEYTLSVVSSGCGGARIYTTRVLLNNLSGMIAMGNTPICQGGTLQLSTGQIGGTLYNWSGPNGFTSSLRTPSLINILPVSGGLYTLVVAIPGCGQSTSTVNIMVGHTLTGLLANTSSPVCVAGSLGLSASQTLSTYSYQWLGPLGFTSNQSSATVSGLVTGNAGVYSLRVTSPGCGTREVTTTPVQVYNPASLTANSNTPCVGSSLNLVGAVLGSTVNYQWNGPGGFIYSGRIARQFNAQLSHSGIYTLSADVPGCGWVSTTRTATVVTCKLGNGAPVKNDSVVSTADIKNDSFTKEFEVNEGGSVVLTAWPNPNEGSHINLKWEGLSKDDPTITIKVYDIQGKLAHLQSSKRKDKSPLHTDVISFERELSKGQYLIETINQGSHHYLKLIVE